MERVRRRAGRRLRREEERPRGSWRGRIAGLRALAALLYSLASLALAAAPASAEAERARPGAYIGLGGFYALQNFDDNTAIDTRTNIAGSDTGGVRVKGGFRLEERWAAEIAFQYFDDFELVAREDDGTLIRRDRFDGWTLMGNAKMFLHHEAFQPYLLAGAGALVMHKQGPDAAFTFQLGGGIDVYLTQHLVFDVEVAYMLPAPKLEDFQFMTVTFGATWRY